eukprot:TRINITY_DN17832_c0_g1_i1.p1 TRINITY_DN17832_c0_g1~~TRINITY_DN17832_c0_g1_i1.p1  ORF type:complete len:505 (+),score=49.28 TRINITY_DN17832_c0_g1_i1:170-1684(+)
MGTKLRWFHDSPLSNTLVNEAQREERLTLTGRGTSTKDRDLEDSIADVSTEPELIVGAQASPSWWLSFCNALYPRSGETSTKSGSVRFDALDGTRWIASIHIVTYHFYQWEPSLRDHSMWFSVWTQYFFMLSGFVLAYAEMVRSPKKGDSMPMHKYIRRRLIVVYPIYLFSLILTIASHGQRPVAGWMMLPLHIALVQAWLPICVPEDGWHLMSPWTYNGDAWFLSVLFLYWFSLRALARFFRSKDITFCGSVLVVCTMFPWFIMTARGYIEQQPQCQELCKAYVELYVRASPFGYFHIFVAGVALARCFILTAMRDARTGSSPQHDSDALELAVQSAPWIFKYGCVLGYGTYFTLMFLAPDWMAMDKYYYYFHNGGMLPVMLLIIMGASVGIDPIATWLLRSKPMMVLGSISYAQYLMQHILRHMMDDFFGWTDNALLRACFVPMLVAFAYFCHTCVEEPYTQYQRWQEEKGVTDNLSRILKWILGDIPQALSRLCATEQVTV